jgi:hypothetical protein
MSVDNKPVPNMQPLYDSIMQKNRVKQTGIMIATPMYGGQCTGEYALSLAKTCIMLHDLGYKYYVETLFNESLIPRGRNLLVNSFMSRPEMDYLLFIDADIGFTELDVLKLLLAEREVAAAIYPKKRINWGVVNKAALAGKTNLSDYTGDFVFNPISKQDESEPDSAGMLEVKHVGTGFMMIKRSVFEHLAPHVPTYKEPRDDGSIFEAKDFFQIGVDDKGFYVSEDYFFCDLWRKHGGSIFMNPYIKLTHTGTYVFSGDFRKMGTEQL